MSTTPTNLTIAIIGAGKLGEPLARLFTSAGHTVRIANSRGPETLRDVEQRTGATAATVDDATAHAHLVVVAVPQRAIPHLDKRLFMSLQQSIVLDATDYDPDGDGRIEAIEGGMVESRWVETQLGREVVKAFNTIDAYSLERRGKPAGADDRIGLPVSGGNPVHKATVVALLDQMGFDGVDAGSIEESWRQQPGTPVYCTDWDKAEVRRLLGRADRDKSASVRDELMKKWAPQLKTGPETWESLYKVAREVMAEHYPKE